MQLKQSRGFMLIEVLVAMLLAGLAVVALAGAQAAALRATRASQHRVVAAQLAADLAERMRLNRGGFTAGGGSPYQLQAGWAGQDGASCDGAATTCSNAQFAQADVAQWRQLLKQNLPAGAAHVEIDSAQGSASIWVAWREPLAPSDETPRAEGECPAALGADAASGVRCVHLRTHW